LYAALKEAGAPLTSAELAGKLRLSERWVREWLLQQVGAWSLLQGARGMLSASWEGCAEAVPLARRLRLVSA
jgi:hypothetical protein